MCKDRLRFQFTVATLLPLLLQKVAPCRKKSFEKVDILLQKSLEKVLDLWYTMCEVRK